MQKESANLTNASPSHLGQSDISREGLTAEKILQLGRLFLPQNNHAIAKVSRFDLIDLKKINRILGTNFRGAILDVDECIAPHHGEILPENIDAVIKMVQDKISIAVFSNMKAGARYMPFIEAVKGKTGYKIPIITSRFAKPDPRGFLESLETLQLWDGEQAVMIGDNFVTDGGCIGAGIPFIKVDPVPTTGEPIYNKLKRSPEIVTRKFHIWLSELYDALLARKVLKDEDFFRPTQP